MLTSIINRGLAWLFPDTCVGCRQSGTVLCDNCLTLINPPRDLENPGMLAALPYEHKWVKKLIWRLKYYRGKHLAERLAEILTEKLLEEISDTASFNLGEDKWLVIPVPQSKTRNKIRKYNQAAEIAKSLVEQNKNFLEFAPQLVEKIRDTLPQAKVLNRKDRLFNVKDSFAVVSPETVRGRRVLIVDDVITTGATVGEIKKVLKEAGARLVLGIAVAHG